MNTNIHEQTEVPTLSKKHGEKIDNSRFLLGANTRRLSGRVMMTLAGRSVQGRRDITNEVARKVRSQN